MFKKIVSLTTILIVIAQVTIGCDQVHQTKTTKKAPLVPYVVFSPEQMSLVNLNRTLSGSVMLGIYEMQVQSASGDTSTDWITKEDDGICMAYTSKENWAGAMIKGLYGDDFSQYKTLSLELKGKKGGEYLSIGLTDNKGNHQEVYVDNLSKQWKRIEIPLTEYTPKVDLSQLSGITSFVFGGKSQTVCFRRIEYLP